MSLLHYFLSVAVLRFPLKRGIIHCNQKRVSRIPPIFHLHRSTSRHFRAFTPFRVSIFPHCYTLAPEPQNAIKHSKQINEKMPSRCNILAVTPHPLSAGPLDDFQYAKQIASLIVREKFRMLFCFLFSLLRSFFSRSH